MKTRFCDDLFGNASFDLKHLTHRFAFLPVVSFDPPTTHEVQSRDFDHCLIAEDTKAQRKEVVLLKFTG